MSNLISQPLAYTAKLEERAIELVDLVVIHCTELPGLTEARQYAEQSHYKSGTGNSGHYYIDRDGSIFRYVPPNRIAHHTIGFNPRSIGIELINRGRYPDWFDSHNQLPTEPYPDAQIGALVELLRDLCKQLPRLSKIAGHEHLDLSEVPASDNPELNVRRKVDPGPQFPWAEVLAGTTLQRL